MVMTHDLLGKQFVGKYGAIMDTPSQFPDTKSATGWDESPIRYQLTEADSTILPGCALHYNYKCSFATILQVQEMQCYNQVQFLPSISYRQLQSVNTSIVLLPQAQACLLSVHHRVLRNVILFKVSTHYMQSNTCSNPVNSLPHGEFITTRSFKLKVLAG